MYRPTVNDIAEEILIHARFTDGSKPIDLINATLVEIAGKVLIPDLETDATVTTSLTLSYIALPVDYMREMVRCYNETQISPVTIDSSLSVLLSRYEQPNQAGPVEVVAIRARNLHYQLIPETAETLRLHYWKKPDEVAHGEATPSWLPETLVRPLLVSGSCSILFDQMGEAYANKAAIHEAKFNRFLHELSRFIGPNDHGYSAFSA